MEGQRDWRRCPFCVRILCKLALSCDLVSSRDVLSVRIIEESHGAYAIGAGRFSGISSTTCNMLALFSLHGRTVSCLRGGLPDLYSQSTNEIRELIVVDRPLIQRRG